MSPGHFSLHELVLCWEHYTSVLRTARTCKLNRREKEKKKRAKVTNRSQKQFDSEPVRGRHYHSVGGYLGDDLRDRDQAIP